MVTNPEMIQILNVPQIKWGGDGNACDYNFNVQYTIMSIWNTENKSKDLNVCPQQINLFENQSLEKTKKDPKRMSVERIYQKKTQLEHILLRPDSYIGSVETVTQVKLKLPAGSARRMWTHPLPFFSLSKCGCMTKMLEWTAGM